MHFLCINAQSLMHFIQIFRKYLCGMCALRNRFCKGALRNRLCKGSAIHGWMNLFWFFLLLLLVWEHEGQELYWIHFIISFCCITRPWYQKERQNNKILKFHEDNMYEIINFNHSGFSVEYKDGDFTFIPMFYSVCLKCKANYFLQSCFHKEWMK